MHREDFSDDTGGPTLVQLSFYFGGALLFRPSSSRFVFVRTPLTEYGRYDGLYLQGAAQPDGSSEWEALLHAFGSPIP